MKLNSKTKLTIPVLAALALTAGTATAVPVSEADILANWTEANSAYLSSVFGLEQESNNWSLSGSTLSNGGNLDGSFLSDFSSLGDFSFSTQIRGNGDNDLFGILFEVQDYNNNYSLTWGGGGVGVGNGIQLRRNDGASSSTLLASQSGSWVSGRIYDFSASRSGNDLTVSVLDGITTIFSTTVTDTTYSLGGVGFDVWSNSASFSFGNTDFTSTAHPTPEGGGTLALLSLACLGLRFCKRRK